MLVAPVGGPPELARFHLELVEAVQALQRPREPQPVWACDADQLPAADRYPSCVALARDLGGVLVVSDGTNWIRQDTGAAI